MATLSQVRARAKASTRSEAEARLRYASTAGVVLSLLLMAFGAQWDVHWHVRVGRDWFWIPPHMMVYSGVALSGLLALLVTAWSTLWGPKDAPGRWDLFGIQAPAGFALVGLGALSMVFSAPFDDLWHGRFGIDLTIWSPPHLGGIFGSGLILLGLLAESATGPHGIVRERAGRLAWFAFVLAGSGLLRTGIFANIPASQYTFWGDDFSFQFFGWRNAYLFPIVMSFFGAYVAVQAARVSRRPWMPLALLAMAFLMNRVSRWVAESGTEALVRATGHHYRPELEPLGFSTAQMFLWPLLGMVLPFVVAAVLLTILRHRSNLRAGLLGGLAVALTLYLEFAVVYLPLAWPPRQLPLPSPGLAIVSLALCLGLGALSGLLGGRLARALETEDRLA